MSKNLNEILNCGFHERFLEGLKVFFIRAPPVTRHTAHGIRQDDSPALAVRYPNMHCNCWIFGKFSQMHAEQSCSTVLYYTKRLFLSNEWNFYLKKHKSFNKVVSTHTFKM